MGKPYKPEKKFLNNHFLIATPQVEDPFFKGSVIYVCEHDKNGAMGLIINKPSPIKMYQLFEAIEKKTPEKLKEKWVLMGGPIQIDRGFLLHTPVGNWQSSLIINDKVAITTSKDIIIDLSEKGAKNTKTLATIGHVVWIKDQLETEIEDNSWLVAPSNENILFDTPYFKRYEESLKLIGLKPYNLSKNSGNA